MSRADAWSRGRMKWDTVMVAGGTPSTDVSSYWLNGDDEDGMPFVAISDMSRRVLVTTTSKSLSREGMRSRVMPVGSPGTLLLAMYASVGEVAFLGVEATWNQALLGIITNPARLQPRFLYYVLLDMRADLLREVRSNTQANLNAGQIGDVWFRRPPRDEQRAIADYLDRETAQIDALIGKQRRLIETLRERRVAVISKAVTRGLVANATSRETHIDWLGEIPAHWTAGRLKNAVQSTQTGVWGDEPQGDETDILCVRVADFDRPRLRVPYVVPTVRSVRPSEAGPRLLQPGDLLLEKSGGTGLNPVGFVAIFEGAAGPAVSSNFLTRIRLRAGQLPRYWLYSFAASYSTKLTARSVKQTTGIQNLDQAHLFDETFPFPPLHEQRRIVDYLDEQTAKIDALIAKAERFIEVSRERRSALISAAVTGQMDVRDRV